MPQHFVDPAPETGTKGAGIGDQRIELAGGQIAGAEQREERPVVVLQGGGVEIEIPSGGRAFAGIGLEQAQAAPAGQDAERRAIRRTVVEQDSFGRTALGVEPGEVGRVGERMHHSNRPAVESREVPTPRAALELVPEVVEHSSPIRSPRYLLH